MMNDWQEYLLKKYPKRFKNKKIIVTERETHFEIQTNKDESPLILSKDGQLKAALEQIILEMRMLDERISGVYAFIQQLPNYDEIVEQLKEKAKQNENEKKLEI